MSHYDQRNVVSVALATIFVAAAFFALLALHLDNVTKVQVEQERTDRAKVEVCKTIEDPAERTLCLTAVKR